jgi:hypothetical protein
MICVKPRLPSGDRALGIITEKKACTECVKCAQCYEDTNELFNRVCYLLHVGTEAFLLYRLLRVTILPTIYIGILAAVHPR